jgi:hypothetical protein
MGGQQHALKRLVGDAQGWLAESESTRRVESGTRVIPGVALEEDGRTVLRVGTFERIPDHCCAYAPALTGREDGEWAQHLDDYEPALGVEERWSEHDVTDHSVLGRLGDECATLIGRDERSQVVHKGGHTIAAH